MNITKLVGLHLYNYLASNGELGTQTFALLQRQIDEGHDLQDRKNLPGHVTSGFFLLDPTMTKVLMIYHKVLQKWLCPGGHYEGMETPRKSALRELEEETSFPADKTRYLNELGYLALDLDSHAIPANPAKDEPEHIHHDFLYLGVATEFIPADQLKAQLIEVDDVAWKTLDEAAAMPDERVRRAVQKVRKQINAASEV